MALSALVFHSYGYMHEFNSKSMSWITMTSTVGNMIGFEMNSWRMAQSCKHDAIHSTVKVYILYILYKCKNHMENIQQHNLAEVSSTSPRAKFFPTHPHPSQKAILSGMQNVHLPQFCQVYDYWQSMPYFRILVLLSLVVPLYLSVSWQDETYVHP